MSDKKVKSHPLCQPIGNKNPCDHVGLSCFFRGFCDDFTHEEILFISNNQVTQNYKKNQTLFLSGDLAQGLYFILKGKVKLELIDENGKAQIIQIMEKGQILGYRALFSGEPYVASAITSEAVTVSFLAKDAVFELIKRHPDIAFKFLKQLSADFKMIETRYQHATTLPATARIAEALLFLRDSYKDKNWTRKEIAEWAGTTPETVMRTLTQLEEEGLITTKGKEITILNRVGLLKKSGIKF